MIAGRVPRVRLVALLPPVWLAGALLANAVSRAEPADIGADLPWTTYEAETMKTSGEVLGPRYDPYQVETESSGERCVKLASPGAYLEFVAAAPANAMVIRYSLPDAAAGGGTEATLRLTVNGKAVRTLPLTSHYAYLYGNYPFSNDPRQGKTRNFYDEVRVKNVPIAKGDAIRIEKAAGGAPFCIVDLIDLEMTSPPKAPPAGALSVLDFGAGGNGSTDDTAALRRCIAAAAALRKTVWVPAGEYRLTGDIVVPTHVAIQGAGMWHTTFVGDERLYGDAGRRVRFKLAGEHIRLADFAIVGRLNYRNDSEPNDGIVSDGCSDSAVERIWVEHTKVGMWLYNGERLRIEGCRFRDTIADGINLCVGTADNIVENCSARGTGDDCFAIWPAPADQGFAEAHRPGNNVIRRCTGQLPFLANGGALYGGANNRIEDCRFVDITAGCGILVSTTFPTFDTERHIDNNFSGTTTIANCDLVRCGGYDHDWAWRGSFQICMDRRSISGLAIGGITIRDSLSDGLTIIGPGSAKGEGMLANTQLERVTISNCGLSGISGRNLWIRRDASGGIAIADSNLGRVQNDSPSFTIAR